MLPVSRSSDRPSSVIFTTAPRSAATAGLAFSLPVVIEESVPEHLVERVELVAPAVAAEVIAGTDRVALVQSRLVPRLTASRDIRALPCPFDAIPIAEALWWHPMYERDPAHAWLRRILGQAGRRIAASRPAGQQAARAGAEHPDILDIQTELAPWTEQGKHAG
jgi:DNA-binding transcriptional LysR family regulator